MNLTPENKAKILRQADAIRRLQAMPAHGLAPNQVIKLESGYAGTIEVCKSFDINSDNWLRKLEHDCFWTLIEQGYEKYIENLKHIAETGELP